MDSKGKRRINLSKKRPRGGSDTEATGSSPSPSASASPSVPNHDPRPSSLLEKAPFAGLFNLGNTCYANSVIQIIKFCPGMPSIASSISQQVDEFDKETGKSAQLNEKQLLFLRLSSLIQELTELTERNMQRQMENLSRTLDSSEIPDPFFRLSSVSIRDPRSFFSAVRPELFVKTLRQSKSIFSTYTQQDAQEFFKYLLSCFQEAASIIPQTLENSQANNNPATGGIFIENLFQGTLENTIRCMECETPSTMAESFFDISIPVEESRSLSWSINEFTSRESLNGFEKYLCNVCRTRTEAERWIRFLKLPPIFTIHLKRFSYTATDRGLQQSKISCPVPAPSKFRFGEWCSPDCPDKDRLYELFAIIFHTGSSAGSGHYITYVKIWNHSEVPLHDKGKAEWLKFDDIDVRYVTQQHVMEMLTPFTKSKDSAYLIFYRRLDS